MQNIGTSTSSDAPFRFVAVPHKARSFGVPSSPWWRARNDFFRRGLCDFDSLIAHTVALPRQAAGFINWIEANGVRGR